MNFFFILEHTIIGDIMRILITGAASGIGYLLAEKLSSRGHTVYITVHTNEQLKMVKEKLKDENKKILCFKLDIRNKKDRELIKTLEIDVLVNHAGIGHGGSLLEMDIDVLKENYETNIFSSFELLKEFYQIKKERKQSAQIFVTSSVASMLPIPYLGCYTSSKAAISMLVFTIKQELKYLDNNISISLIEPGAYKTGFNQVMVDNKTKFLYKDNKIYKNRNSINRLQKALFAIIEKENPKNLVNKIIKEIESNNPKFKIRVPFIQGLAAKIYLMLFR